MKSAECSAAGSNPPNADKRKGIHFVDTLSSWERLREEGRSGTVVLVGVVEPVGVELDLAVVEVEDRRVREVAIGVRNIVPVRPCHQTLSFTSCWKQAYTLSVLNLIRRYLSCDKTRTRPGQAVSPQHNTLLETVVSMTLVAYR